MRPVAPVPQESASDRPRLIQRILLCPDATKIIALDDQSPQEFTMMDVLMLALAFGLFALAIGYTYACERL